ncbi:MAG: hypothetical protein Q7R33_00765 [Nitrosarchaeum sp.]|nr:hypothetical protein [Nitrosarchaeum sp.]
MSKQVKGLTELHDSSILKQTLTEMNIHFNEKDSRIEWGAGYDKMSIDTSTGEVSYDEMKNHQLNALKKNYSKNFILAEIVKKGHRVDSVREVGGNIEIIAGY